MEKVTVTVVYNDIMQGVWGRGEGCNVDQFKTYPPFLSVSGTEVHLLYTKAFTVPG